ncbi:hypothetical protein E4U55_004251 [Claviceps digitariae]|nr:hypothetical protein E4U55_004251 [Claviceps digitariae]
MQVNFLLQLRFPFRVIENRDAVIFIRQMKNLNRSFHNWTPRLHIKTTQYIVPWHTVETEPSLHAMREVISCPVTGNVCRSIQFTAFMALAS